MRLFITCVIYLICVQLYGQNERYVAYQLSEAVETQYMPQQDNASLKQVELRSRKKGRPDSFAKNLKVNISTNQVGTWDYTDNDIAVWRYKIISKSAKTLNLGFTEFDMPVEGKLFLYGANKSHILGPFTKADNEDRRQLWTPVIEGEEITIEIQIPISNLDELQLKLEYVNHDFMDIMKSGSESSSGSCNIDVVCSEEDGFPIIDTKRDIINAVGAFTLNGTQQCTGVLINNARNDCTPYFLTANHCEVSTGNAASVVVYWNYQNSECRQPDTVESGNDGDGTFDQFTSGSTFLAGYAPSDFTLLLLDEEVSPDFSPFYAGWNVGRTLPSSSVCIHHPNVEEKRISIDLDPNVISIDAAEDSFIRVNSWDFGTTEKGSSGAPLFNDDNEVIGLLNSGQATCINNAFDDFGPMFLSWEGGGTKDTRLKDWLDPENLGLQSLPGKNCTFVLQLEETVVEVCGETTDSQTLGFNLNENFENETTISFGDLPPGLQIDLVNEKLAPGAAGSFTLNNLNDLAPDVYQIEVIADDGINNVISSLVIKLFNSQPSSIEVVSPADGEDGLLTNVLLEWETISEDVDIEISQDDQFQNVELALSVEEASKISVKDLTPGTKYFWRLRTNNICGVGEWSGAYSFITGQIFCSNSLTNSEVFIIPDFQADTIVSGINVNLSGVVRNVEITNIDGEHTWVGDLQINLVSPSGTVVRLIDTECEDSDDFSLGFSDDLGEDDFPCPITDGRLYQPVGNLSSLNGELASGLWSLQVIDLATLDGGQLDSWSLSICTEISTEAIIYLGASELNLCNISEETISIGLGLGFSGPVNLSIDGPSGVVGTFNDESIDGGSATQLTLSNLDNLAPGEYEIAVIASDDGASVRDVINLSIGSSITRVDLLTPSNGLVDTELDPELTWDDGGRGNTYFIQVSTNEEFSDVILEKTVTTTNYTIEDDLLDELTEYFWRIAAGNECGARLSGPFTFITGMKTSTFQIDNAGMRIYPNPASELIKIESGQGITNELDLNLYDIRGRRIVTSKLIPGQRNLEINVRNLISGVYFLKLESQHDSHIEKIIINN